MILFFMQVATKNRIVGYFFVVLTQSFCTKAAVYTAERFILQETFLSLQILIYILWAYPWRRNSSFRLSIKFQFVSFMQFFQLLCCHLKILQIACEKKLFPPKIDLFCDVCVPKGHLVLPSRLSSLLILYTLARHCRFFVHLEIFQRFPTW